nr:hypothetical protein [Tanacetum cinerariifolium]
LASLEVSEESFKQAVGTGELAVGMGDSTVTPPIKVAAPVKAAVASTRRKRGVVIWDPEEESSAKLKPPPRTKEKFSFGFLCSVVIYNATRIPDRVNALVLHIFQCPEVVEGSGKKAKSRGKAAVSKKRARKGLDEETMMDKDNELAERLQVEEHGELSIEERSKLFVELMNQRKKQFARLSAEEKRRKPPTKAQKRNQIAMLDDFNRKDVLDLYRMVKEIFETTSPEGYDRLLWGDLMTLFEPSKEDEI